MVMRCDLVHNAVRLSTFQWKELEIDNVEDNNPADRVHQYIICLIFRSDMG